MSAAFKKRQKTKPSSSSCSIDIAGQTNEPTVSQCKPGQQQQQQQQPLEGQTSLVSNAEPPEGVESVAYYSFNVDSRLADLLASDANVDAILADIETTCGCSVLVDKQQRQRTSWQPGGGGGSSLPVPVEVIMNETDGDFPNSARRLGELIDSLGGQWRVQRLVKRLPLLVGGKASGFTYRVVAGSNCGGKESHRKPSSSSSSGSVGGSGSDGGGSGGGSESSCSNSPASSGSGTSVVSFTDEQANSGQWSVNSTVTPFLRLRRLQQRLQLQQQEQLQQSASKLRNSPWLTRLLWCQAVRMLAEATRLSVREAAAGEQISLVGAEASLDELQDLPPPAPHVELLPMCSNCSHEPAAEMSAGPTLLLSALMVDPEATAQVGPIRSGSEENDSNLALIDDSSFPSSSRSFPSSSNSIDVDIGGYINSFRMVGGADVEQRTLDFADRLSLMAHEAALTATAQFCPLRAERNAQLDLLASRLSHHHPHCLACINSGGSEGSLSAGSMSCIEHCSACQTVSLGQPLQGHAKCASPRKHEVSVCHPTKSAHLSTEANSAVAEATEALNSTYTGVCTRCFAACQQRALKSTSGSANAMLTPFGTSASLCPALAGGRAHVTETAMASLAAGSECHAAAKISDPLLCETSLRASGSCRLSTLQTATPKQRCAHDGAPSRSGVARQAAAASAALHQFASVQEHKSSLLTSRATCRVVQDGAFLATTFGQHLLSCADEMASSTAGETTMQMPIAHCSTCERRGCAVGCLQLTSSSREQCMAHACPSGVQSKIAPTCICHNFGAVCDRSHASTSSGCAHPVCCHRDALLTASEAQRSASSVMSVRSVTLSVFRPAALEARSGVYTLVFTAQPDKADSLATAVALDNDEDQLDSRSMLPLFELNSNQPSDNGLIASFPVASVEALLAASTHQNACDSIGAQDRRGLATETVVSLASQCDECASAQPAPRWVTSGGAVAGCRHAPPQALVCQVRCLQDGIVDAAATWQSLARLIAGATAALELSIAWPGLVWRRSTASAELTASACWVEARRHGAEADKVDSGSVCVFSELVWHSRQRHQLARAGF